MTGAVACRWHNALIDQGEAVLVGAIERGSGPPLPVYACGPCVAGHELLPLVEHPKGSDGSPRRRDGRRIAGPGLLVTR